MLKLNILPFTSEFIMYHFRPFDHPSMDYQPVPCIIWIAEGLVNEISTYDTWLLKSAINRIFIALDLKQYLAFYLNLRYPMILLYRDKNVS